MTSERSIFIKIKRLFKFLHSCVAKAAGMFNYFNRTHYCVRIAVTDTHTHTHTHTHTDTVTLAAHARRELKMYTTLQHSPFSCVVVVAVCRLYIQIDEITFIP